MSHLKDETQLHGPLIHDNLISFIGQKEDKDALYCLLEFAPNGALYFFIPADKGLPEKLALRFFKEVSLAVQYLHSLGIAHRDIKPENILLGPSIEAKLGDFGWACRLEPGDARSSICGTPEYMAPEILLTRKHGLSADIWALGILLYEMLHGKVIR